MARFLVLLLLCLSLSPLAWAQLSPSMQARLDWLKTHGTPIWIGEPASRSQVQACRKDYGVVVAKAWGTALIHHNAEIRPCPGFFYQDHTPARPFPSQTPLGPSPRQKLP